MGLNLDKESSLFRKLYSGGHPQFSLVDNLEALVVFISFEDEVGDSGVFL